MKTLWTIGHSRRELGDFLDLLASQQIETVADVRRYPGSRRSPQFGREELQTALRNAGLSYVHFPGLGGRRHQHAASTQSAAWRVAAFAAYADFMLTDEFARAFGQLAELAAESRTVVMCAETLPWRCHRRLIADQFVAFGWRVVDIVGPGQTKEHALPPFARVVNGQVTYPG